jgi:hypothetical protein
MKTLQKPTLLALLILLLAGCKLNDNYFINPSNITNPAQVGFGSLLQAAELSAGAAAEMQASRLAALWTRQATGVNRQHGGYQAFQISGTDMDAQWTTWYQGALQPALQLKANALAVNNRRYAGIARVLESYCYGMLADMFGDVPRTQSNNLVAFPQPAYDSQISVYQYVITNLGTAISDLTAPASVPIPSSDDFFYQGDIASWIALANSLRARYALHVARNPGSIFSSSAVAYQQAATWAAVGIGSAVGSWRMPHGPTYLGNFNTWYSFLVYDRSGDVDGTNAYLGFLLDPSNTGPATSSQPSYRGNAKTDETGRFNYYYQALGAPGQYDLNYIWSGDFGTPSSSDGFLAATASFPLMTYEETLLIQAEALVRAGDFANSLVALNTLRAYYNTGAHLTADYAALNGANPYQAYVAADFNSGGIENVGGALTPNNALLREIMQERYVTLFCQFEALFDAFRTYDQPTTNAGSARTGNVAGVPFPIVGSGTQFPVRLLYSQLERNNNPNTPVTTLFTPRMGVNN